MLRLSRQAFQLHESWSSRMPRPAQYSRPLLQRGRADCRIGYPFHVSQIVLIHHSDCGASHINKEQALDSIRKKRPEFTDFKELEARLPVKEDNRKSVVGDLQLVKSNGFLRNDLIDGVAGFWLDVETGLLTRVYPRWPDEQHLNLARR